MGIVVTLSNTQLVLQQNNTLQQVVERVTQPVAVDLGQNALGLETTNTVPASVVVGVPGIQGPPGVNGSGVAVLANGVNGDVVTLLQGQPVMVNSSGAFVLGKNALAGQYIGLVNTLSAAPGVSVQVLQNGTITQPQAAWNAITGNIGGLAPGMPYFINGSGQITFIAPSSGPIILVGVALNSTTMQVRSGLTVL